MKTTAATKKQSKNIQEKEQISNDKLPDSGNREGHESSETGEVVEIKEFKGKTFTVELTAGAILGALSVLFGITWDAYVESLIGGPAFAPGMTWFDVVAVPMLVAFFVFGIRSGLIAAIIGCGAILFYPSEAYGWVAMIAKFCASATMFVVPWLILKLNKRAKENNTKFLPVFKYSSETFKPVANYWVLMGFAIIARLIVMFLVNTLVILPIYIWLLSGKGTFQTVFTNPIEFLSFGGGYTIWNVVQGIADAVIAYLIVYPTKLNERFATW
ncbi:MAG: hypothetical protein GF308_13980 [Candidatus Heimdallarchaeota archaeon]|nr:hypothetical protein [Candidatus Heimdallarchaeota archaeon]